MGDIPLYLSNVSVSIGQAVEVEAEQVGLTLCACFRRSAKALTRMSPSFRLAARRPVTLMSALFYLPRCTCASIIVTPRYSAPLFSSPGSVLRSGERLRECGAGGAAAAAEGEGPPQDHPLLQRGDHGGVQHRRGGGGGGQGGRAQGPAVLAG